MSKPRAARKERQPTTRGAVALRSWLEGSNTSQAELAEKLGVRQTTVSNWLGDMSPRIEHALRLKKLAGVPLEAWGERVDAVPSSAA